MFQPSLIRVYLLLLSISTRTLSLSISLAVSLSLQLFPGIVIKYENMSYKTAVHHAHQVLSLAGKANKYVHDLFDAPGVSAASASHPTAPPLAPSPRCPAVCVCVPMWSSSFGGVFVKLICPLVCCAVL